MRGTPPRKGPKDPQFDLDEYDPEEEEAVSAKKPVKDLSNAKLKEEKALGVLLQQSMSTIMNMKSMEPLIAVLKTIDLQPLEAAAGKKEKKVVDAKRESIRVLLDYINQLQAALANPKLQQTFHVRFPIAMVAADPKNEMVVAKPKEGAYERTLSAQSIIAFERAMHEMPEAEKTQSEQEDQARRKVKIMADYENTPLDQRVGFIEDVLANNTDIGWLHAKHNNHPQRVLAEILIEVIELSMKKQSQAGMFKKKENVSNVLTALLACEPLMEALKSVNPHYWEIIQRAQTYARQGSTSVLKLDTLSDEMLTNAMNSNLDAISDASFAALRALVNDLSSKELSKSGKPTVKLLAGMLPYIQSNDRAGLKKYCTDNHLKKTFKDVLTEAVNQSLEKQRDSRFKSDILEHLTTKAPGALPYLDAKTQEDALRYSKTELGGRKKL